MYWMIGRKSQLSTENKILIYKNIIISIWSYGIQLWGTASLSNISIIQRFQNKMLRCIVNVPWYVPNKVIEKDLCVVPVTEVIKRASKLYNVKLQAHPNILAYNLTDDSGEVHRLKRYKPNELVDRFS